MTYGKYEVLAMESSAIRTNRKGASRKEQRKLTFSELDLVGQARLPVMGKTIDGKDKLYRS